MNEQSYANTVFLTGEEERGAAITMWVAGQMTIFLILV